MAWLLIRHLPDTMDFPCMYLSGASQLSYVSPATSWEFATAENLLSSCKKYLWLMTMSMFFSARLNVKERAIFLGKRENQPVIWTDIWAYQKVLLCTWTFSQNKGPGTVCALWWNCSCCVCVCMCVFSVRFLTYPLCYDLHLYHICFCTLFYSHRKGGNNQW